MTEPKVQPYEPRDRAPIRSLCCDVAFAGRPLEEWLKVDRDLFADLFTRYYTDIEPDSVGVVRGDEGLLGYTCACTDTARYRTLWRRRVLLPALARVVVGRYAFPVSALPRLLAVGAAYVRGGGLKVPWREFPGHLHINTAPQCRGRAALSRALLYHAFGHLAARGVTRVHAVVMTSRARMEEKYQRLGFAVVNRQRAPRPDRRGAQAWWLVLTLDLRHLPPRHLDTASLRQGARSLAL